MILSLSGCRTSKIYNVHDASFASIQQSNLTLQDVKSAIIRAGVALGWKMVPKEEGHIIGTLALRSHLAVVDINYTKESYSIIYKDSTNLNYNGTHIHSNYNGWIQNLEKGINAQIAIAKY